MHSFSVACIVAASVAFSPNAVVPLCDGRAGKRLFDAVPDAVYRNMFRNEQREEETLLPLHRRSISCPYRVNSELNFQQSIFPE